MILLLAFVVGVAVGSFLNVCIWRLPAEQSIVRPPSHCPQCDTPIRPRDNIPILSYLLLRGRCRDCGVRISPRYPAVEALTGVAAVLLVQRYGLSPELAVYGAFVAALIVVSFIDIDHQIIPDVISYPGIVIGFVCASLWGVGWSASLLGILLGGGTLWAVAAGYYAMTGREGMGGGDIKLLAMIGAFLGWRAVLVTLVLGSFSGAFLGITLIALRGRDVRVPIPFGPFLAMGAICALFFGDPLIGWYLELAIGH